MPEPFYKLFLFVRDQIVSGVIRQRRWLVFRGYVIVATGGFIFLAILSRSILYFPIDLIITKTFQLYRIPPVDFVLKFVTELGRSPVFPLLQVSILLLIWVAKLRLEFIVAAINIIGIFVLEAGTKLIVQRPRPGADLVNVLVNLNDFSFPSGHVLSYVAFFGYLIFLAFSLFQKRKPRTLAIIIFGALIVLVGPSRIYLGEHWASDTLGGYLLGSVWLVIVIEIYILLRQKFPMKKTSPELKPGTEPVK